MSGPTAGKAAGVVEAPAGVGARAGLGAGRAVLALPVALGLPCGGDVLRPMISLNALWALTDPVHIPLLGPAKVDFYAEAAVNAALAIGLAVTGRRAGVV